MENIERRQTQTTATVEDDFGRFNYDIMYIRQMKAGNLKEPDLDKSGSLLRYLVCELLATRSETILDVALPSHMLECRSFLEMYSDFVRPGLLADIPSGSTPNERMLRVLKFYMAGLSKMRGFEGMARKPLHSVKGECFRCLSSHIVLKKSNYKSIFIPLRCNWRPHKIKTEVTPPDYIGIAEDYLLDEGSLITTQSKKVVKGLTRTSRLPSSGGKYTKAGLIAANDPNIGAT